MNKKISKFFINTTDTVRELFILYIAIIGISSILYSLFEHKSYLDSLWWAFVTASTVGYGDTYPVTFGGRIIAILLMNSIIFFVVPLVTARIASKLIVDNNAFTSGEQNEIKRLLRRIDKKINE
jgi:voltage-gated potassium channel